MHNMIHQQVNYSLAPSFKPPYIPYLKVALKHWFPKVQTQRTFTSVYNVKLDLLQSRSQCVGFMPPKVQKDSKCCFRGSCLPYPCEKEWKRAHSNYFSTPWGVYGNYPCQNNCSYLCDTRHFPNEVITWNWPIRALPLAIFVPMLWPYLAHHGHIYIVFLQYQHDTQVIPRRGCSRKVDLSELLLLVNGWFPIVASSNHMSSTRFISMKYCRNT